MNSKEMFALSLRVIGVLGILFVVRHILQCGPSFNVPAYSLVKWAISLLAGLYLIKGAPALVCFAYPDKPGK